MGQPETKPEMATVELPYSPLPLKMTRWRRRRREIAASNECKWISVGLFSAAVILFLVYIFANLDHSESYSNLGPRPEPLCEKQAESMHNETGDCYQMMTKGPCQENLVFMPEEPYRIYGACNCPYMFHNRTILYHQERCYFIFTQAFCPDGHWLTVTDKGEAICEISRCPSVNHSKNGLEDQEWVPIMGDGCAQLGKTMEGCPKGAVVRFHRNYILPSCFQPPAPKKVHNSKDELLNGGISVRSYITCPLGSYRSIVGKCQPRFEFDWS